MPPTDRTLWDRFKECASKGLAGIPRAELLRYMDEIAEALDLMNSQSQSSIWILSPKISS
jgi:hypothetical protein